MKFKKFLRVSILLSMLLAVSFLLIDYASKNQSLEDSSALFGGKPESGYPYAGYLIAIGEGNKVTTCGVTYLTADVAVTAAHCIINEASIYLGVDEFKLSVRSNYEILYAEKNPQWDSKTYKDIAVIKLKDKVTEINNFATQATPVLGCNYLIVGYGMNEDSVEGSLNNKKRKSSEICLEEILSDEVFFKGSGGGICYGDSGSPVFEKGTNKLVGVVSSILVPDNFKGTNYCSVNNRGVMVRLDDNSTFVTEFRNKVSNINCADGSCLASLNEFCSADQGIICSTGLSCVSNSCVANTGIPSLTISSGIIATGDNQKSFIQTISESLNIDFSTPQGALLGGVLFLLFIVVMLLLKFIFF